MNLLELRKWLAELKTGVEQTNASYPKNLVKGWPIPFFGEILSASVLTVGVNPSDKEFAFERRWNQTTNSDAWEKRLLHYFNITGIPPAGWFETWTICLDLLGRTYRDGKAAHVDVSPRATSPMLSQRTDAAEFRRMVGQDVRWFFQLLAGLPNIQLLLVAGPIPRANRSKQQLGDFIRERAPLHNAQWIQDEPFPRLVFPNRPDGVSVCVCPFEPGVDGLYAMVRHVHRNIDKLSELARPKVARFPVLPKPHDWEALVGNFVINFSHLDHTVFQFLELHLTADELVQVRDWHFKDRLDHGARKLKEVGKPRKLQTEFASLIERLTPLRDLRNHVAHGILCIEKNTPPSGPNLVLIQPKDFYNPAVHERRKIDFHELLDAIEALNDLTKEFERLAGYKVAWQGTPAELANRVKSKAS